MSEFIKVGLQQLSFKKADINDIDMLIKTRIEVLRVVNKLPADTDITLVERENYDYYVKSLQNGEHTAHLVYLGDSFVGCGGISYYTIMPTYRNPTGRCAYIMNIYTRPEYRGNGIATKIVELLVDDAKKLGINKISLDATDMGRPIYERFGFVSCPREMELPDTK